LQSARLHFIGHSFGSLVVSNTVRHLSHKMSKGTFSGRIENVCLMQGALSCNWFDGEEVLWSHVQGRIFNIYSRYDTANASTIPWPATRVGLLATSA
jgi:esterase/lipase superfamily enzyme